MGRKLVSVYFKEDSNSIIFKLPTGIRSIVARKMIEEIENKIRGKEEKFIRDILEVAKERKGQEEKIEEIIRRYVSLFREKNKGKGYNKRKWKISFFEMG